MPSVIPNDKFMALDSHLHASAAPEITRKTASCVKFLAAATFGEEKLVSWVTASQYNMHLVASGKTPIKRC